MGQADQANQALVGLSHSKIGLPMSAMGQKRTFGFHSITSSARASTDGGIVRPSALAVLRLITSSYLVGVCTSERIKMLLSDQ